MHARWIKSFWALLIHSWWIEVMPVYINVIDGEVCSYSCCGLAPDILDLMWWTLEINVLVVNFCLSIESIRYWWLLQKTTKFNIAFVIVLLCHVLSLMRALKLRSPSAEEAEHANSNSTSFSVSENSVCEVKLLPVEI